MAMAHDVCVHWHPVRRVSAELPHCKTPRRQVPLLQYCRLGHRPRLPRRLQGPRRSHHRPHPPRHLRVRLPARLCRPLEHVVPPRGAGLPRDLLVHDERCPADRRRPPGLLLHPHLLGAPEELAVAVPVVRHHLGHLRRVCRLVDARLAHARQVLLRGGQEAHGRAGARQPDGYPEPAVQEAPGRRGAEGPADLVLCRYPVLHHVSYQWARRLCQRGDQGQLWLQHAADAAARHGAGFLHHLCPSRVCLPRQEVEPEHLCHAGVRGSVICRHDPAHDDPEYQLQHRCRSAHLLLHHPLILVRPDPRPEHDEPQCRRPDQEDDCHCQQLHLVECRKRSGQSGVPGP